MERTEMNARPIRFSEEESAEVVARSLGTETDPRLREMSTAVEN
jgi:hypothetical protein